MLSSGITGGVWVFDYFDWLRKVCIVSMAGFAHVVYGGGGGGGGDRG